MIPVEFTDRMNEISGFGGSYERGCRCAVEAGVKWVLDHPDEKPEFKGYANIFGVLVEDNQAARDLNRAVDSATFTMDDGQEVKLGDQLTGAMHHAAMNHILFVIEHGWPAYVEKMSSPFEPDSEVHHDAA